MIGDAVAGALLGYTALPYAFLAGLRARRRRAPYRVRRRLACSTGFAMVLLAAVMAAAEVARCLPIFFGVAIAAADEMAASWLVYWRPAV